MFSYLHRYVIFPAVFLAKGIRYKEVAALLKVQEQDGYRNVGEIQKAKLASIISAANRNPFYIGRLTDGGDAQKTGTDFLASLPVLEKQELDQLYRCSAGDRSLAVRDTAGTTGHPVKVRVDVDALSWQVATRYHLYGWHGIDLGDKEARFWGRPVTSSSYMLKDFLLNRKRFCFHHKDRQQNMSEYEALLKYQPSYFYGYSSLILQAAIFFDQEKLPKLPLKAVICTAETIHTFQTEFIERVFGCPVVVEYGCSESDILAFQCEQGSLHLVSVNSVVRQDVGPGHEGEVIYTDLNNRVMPLINYRLGDVATIEASLCQCGRALPVIRSLQGRSINQLIPTTGGGLHAVYVAYAIEEVCQRGFDVRRFKIYYSKGRLEIKVDLVGDEAKFVAAIRPPLDKILNGEIGYDLVLGSIPLDEGRKFSYFEMID